MKVKISLSVMCWLLSISYSLAQVPQKINYQGVARDAGGNALLSQPIGLRFSYHTGSASGPVVYTETFALTTNALGLFSLHLGSGSPVSGTFASIPWASTSVFLETEMDAAGGTAYAFMGTSEMVSVPYALVSGKANMGLADLNDADTTGLSTGDVLQWDGTSWIPGPVSGTGDNWGSQYVIALAPLAGTGTSADPLEISTAGAVAGDVLYYDGGNWGNKSFSSLQYWDSTTNGIYRLGNVAVASTPYPNVWFSVWDSANTGKYAATFEKINTNDSVDAVYMHNAGRGNTLRLYQNGTEGSAAKIVTGNTLNTDPALIIENHRPGMGVYAVNDDTTSEESVIWASHYGPGEAVSATNWNDEGMAASFLTTHSLNESPTVQITHAGENTALFVSKGTVGIGINPGANTSMLAIKDSTLNIRTGLEVEKKHADDFSPAAVLVHHGLGNGVESIHAGTIGSAGYFTQMSGVNVSPTLRVDNVSGTAENLMALTASAAGKGGHFQMVNPANSKTALTVTHTGLGMAQHLRQMNAASDTAAQQVDQLGKGPASMFNVSSGTNDAAAVLSVHNGKGEAGLFINTPLAIKPALHVLHSGTNAGVQISVPPPGAGMGLRVEMLNPTTINPGIYSRQTGTAEAGYFEMQHPTTTARAFFITNAGRGTAAEIEVTNTTSSASALDVDHPGSGTSGNFTQTGTGKALRAAKPSGSGRAGEFINSSTGNTSDGVLIQTNTTVGGTYALHTNHTGAGKGILISGGGDVGGNFAVSGTLSKGGGSFKIDHPLDPENKYLYHSFVESPDMMNIYNGIVTLDASGNAVVTMPAWFDALNRDFRYQLTCIGGFAPVFISSKISSNTFEIAGGTPGLEVSWQVTGIRKDPFAEANRIPVEEDKPAGERGLYLHPGAWDKPAQSGVMESRQMQSGEE